MEKRQFSAYSFPIILLFICLLIVGLFFVPLLPVKLNPSRNLPQIHVNFSMSGQSSRIVEMEVTSKLESMLSRIKGVERISSVSGNGWGSITLRMNKHTNPENARFEASTIIRQTWPSLPEGTSYPYVSMSGTGNEQDASFMDYTIIAPATPILIQEFAQENVQSRLAQIKGVKQVEVRGAVPMMWKLEYDYVQLLNYNITLHEIISAIQSYLKREFLGTGKVSLPEGGERWIRLALVPEYTEESFDPGKIQVANKDGKIVHLSELVKTSRVEQEASAYYRINGLNSIYLSLSAEENANQLALSKEVRKCIEELKEHFPPGYTMLLSYDASRYIQEELDKIYFRSGLTVFILLCFVFLIYRNLKYLFLIAFSLATNISIAVIFYYFLKLEIHLYSLVGITISLTLIIDNVIVMSDQIIRRKNKKVFLAILTATITTMASLVIIFFMDEHIRLNLQDFAWVVIVNLGVSLIVTLFLVPALIDRLNIISSGNDKQGIRRYRSKRFIIRFNSFYTRLIFFLSRWKKTTMAVVVLLFGLPVFILPGQIGSGDPQQDNYLQRAYNVAFGSDFYKRQVKPVTDVAFGGTLRLFADKVYDGTYETDRSETSLHVTASLPNGSTLEQMDFLVRKMEDFIRKHPEVRQFHTSVSSGQRAYITIYFTKEHQRGNAPHIIRSKLVNKALELGGGSWGVDGLKQSFSNELRESAGSYRAKMYGYNYDDLYAWAEEFTDSLLRNQRILEVNINSEFNWFKDDYHEFIFNIDKEKLAEQDILPNSLYASLTPLFGRRLSAGSWLSQTGSEPIRLYSLQAREFDIWNLENFPDRIGPREYKLMELAAVERAKAPQKISKENQQYVLFLQYEFIGGYEQSLQYLDGRVREFNQKAALGYFVERDKTEYWKWEEHGREQYWLILLIVVIIFFTTGILFNSLRQPLVIIFIIPVSFIGLFLTFYWFKLKFDQGGFAAFVMLCGLTVNASIYVLNEYNNILARKKMPVIKAYLKAWNAKISPIFLTIVSTILGFIPFMLGTYKEAFWFPLAAGTIGGLVMSFIGIFLLLPLFIGIRESGKRMPNQA